MTENEASFYLDLAADDGIANLRGLEEEEEEDCFITFTTSESRCDALFERGIDMVAEGDPNAALATFLETLTALQSCQYTNKLLPTLCQVADAYRVLGEVDKSREISDTVSIMQEALDEAMREKWKERKRLGRTGSMFSEQQQQQQQSDCGTLFLKKAEECLGLVCELRERGDVERAVELSERVFRLVQFTLGPEHPRTLHSLRDLTTLYNSWPDSTLQLSQCCEPIIFTATIKSLCWQFSEQKETSDSGSRISSSFTLSGVTLTHSSCPATASDVVSSLLHWSCEDSLSTSSGGEASPQPPPPPLPECCLKEEGEGVETPLLPLQGDNPRAEGTPSTAHSQDVYTDSQPWSVDKDGLEFQCSSNNASHCSSIVSSYLFPLSLGQSSNLATIFTLFVAFGLMAVAAFSVC